MASKTTILATCCAVSLCCAAAIPARADVTYTWDTISASGGSGFAPPATFALSFTVSTDVSVNANSHFADINDRGEGPTPQVTYVFPQQLVSFNAMVASTPIKLDSFVSPCNTSPQHQCVQGQPIWIFDLSADAAAQTADLDLAYLGNNFGDEFQIGSGMMAPPSPALFSTGQITTVTIEGDDSNPYFATYTGELIATDPAPTPEPSTMWTLAGALAMLGFVAARHHSSVTE